MEQLMGAALAGTAQAEVPEGALDGALRDLLPLLPPDPERRLLLAAGVASLYDLAGQVPRSVPSVTPAPPETLAPCSKGVAEVLTAMLDKAAPSAELRLIRDMGMPPAPSGLTAEHDDLLPEALELLQRRHLCLRHVILPAVLSARPEPLRRVLLPVIGERGRWLAQFNPAWAWVPDMESPQLSPEAEAVWEEGKPLERVTMLRRLRRLDPAGARKRLAAAFASEPADIRVKLLGALEVGLSPDDESFLEHVLDDRQPIVRRRAAGLLADLPASACAQRLRRRLDSFLTRTRAGKLTVNVPATLDPAWEREGLEPAGRLPGLDPPGSWLFHTARLVPVGHTLQRFDVSMEELVSGLEGDYELALLEAWTRAATHHGETEALPAFWDGWWERRARPQRQPDLLATMLTELAAHMLPADLVPRLLRLLADPPPQPTTICGRVLQTVAAPWPAELSRAYLDVLRQTTATLAREEAPPVPWLYALLPGARGLAPEAMPDALSLFPIPEPSEKSLRPWYVALLATSEKLQLRRRLLQELTT